MDIARTVYVVVTVILSVFFCLHPHQYLSNTLKHLTVKQYRK
jgi:hypothetical protein